MAVEIERKFLVANDLWRIAAVGSETIRDGFVAASDDRKVRVRTYAERATLTLKTARLGATCVEFEYEIPRADAEEMLNLFCPRATLSKTRHRVPHGGFTWEVDVYEGELEGVVLAEVELERADIEPPLPPWIGPEVTGDPRYKKRAMLRARNAISESEHRARDAESLRSSSRPRPMPSALNRLFSEFANLTPPKAGPNRAGASPPLKKEPDRAKTHARLKIIDAARPWRAAP